jgi:hypothetical protein
VVQAVDTYWEEERYASITADEILVAEYHIPLRLSSQFTAAYDLFFQYVHFWPQKIQTATPVPTATMPVASSVITDFANAYSVQELFGIVELQLPRGWKLTKDDPEHPSPYIMDFSISDQGVVFGTLSIQLMSVQALARSERETNAEAALQAYIDHLMNSCCRSFSEISVTEMDGLVTYHSIQNDQDGNLWDGRYYRPIMDIRAVDIGSGEILLFTFITRGGILPQLMPTYEAILDRAIIHREYILTAPTPPPIQFQAY